MEGKMRRDRRRQIKLIKKKKKRKNGKNKKDLLLRVQYTINRQSKEE